MPYPKFLSTTVHNLETDLVVSQLQKSIRRSDATGAMSCAVELLHSGKSHAAILFGRLLVISMEDLDTTACPWVPIFVDIAVRQAREFLKLDATKMGRVRLPIGAAIRLMCSPSVPRSRENDHFQIAIGLANQLEHKAPIINDESRDKHSRAGRRMGRGLSHFREHGARLFPPPNTPDLWEAEAYRLLELGDSPERKAPAPAADETDDEQGEVFD